jgi:hypothetical protein
MDEVGENKKKKAAEPCLKGQNVFQLLLGGKTEGFSLVC